MKPVSFEYKAGSVLGSKPSLDIKTSRTHSPIPDYVLLREKRKESLSAPALIAEKKNLDGVRRERHNFLMSLREKTVSESFWFTYRRGQIFVRRSARIFKKVTPQIGHHKMVYSSLMGGVVFGILSMALIEQYFGPGVFANTEEPQEVAQTITPIQTYNPENDVFFEYFSQAADEEYEKNVREMLKGYPIEDMVPYILEKDRITAAFLIGIAKKESNWGKRVPVLDGQDCYNYWGYRGIRRMMGTGGHTCFNSQQDAVDTVAKRLEKLIHSQQLDTPEKLVVWKCGFSCDAHNKESVRKWISDVDMYYQKSLEEIPEE